MMRTLEISCITGLYSAHYKPLFRLLKASLAANGMPHADFFDVPQDFFDRSWDDCIWCDSRPCLFQFHHGASIKIDILLKAVRENKEGVVLCMDCDAIVLPGFGQMIREWLTEPNDSWDAIFSAEGAIATDIWRSNVNIGFCLFRCTPRCTSFLESCACAVRRHPDTWDQHEVNELLSESPDLEFRVIPQERLRLFHFHGPISVFQKEEQLKRAFLAHYGELRE